MKNLSRFLTQTVLIIATLFITGCSGGDSHEKVADDALKQMDRMVTAVSAVTDKASAEKAVADLKSVGDELKKIAERAKKLGDPSADVRAKIEGKMSAKQTEITQKMMGMQASMLKAGPEAAAILGKGMMEFGATMQETGKMFGAGK